MLLDKQKGKQFLALGAIFAAMGLVWLAWPHHSASTARQQSQVIESRFSKWLALQSLDLQISVLGQSKLASLIEEPALLAAPGGRHGVHAAHSVKSQGRCHVFISAALIDANPALRAMAQTLQSEAAVWRFVMAHEVAHCLMDAQKMTRATPSGSEVIGGDEHQVYLAEAYADSMALMDFFSQDNQTLEAMTGAVSSLRSSPQLSWGWRTSDAIAQAAALAKEYMRQNPDREMAFGQMTQLSERSAIQGLQLMRDRQIKFSKASN